MAKADTTITPALGDPRWLAEGRLQENLARFPAKITPSAFVDKDAVSVVLTANASQSATALVITAITLPPGVTQLPIGTTLYFGGAKIAVLTAAYTSGTGMTVAALPTALVIGDTATYLPFGTRIAIPSGTLMGRTFAERAASTPFGPWADGDDEFFLSAYDKADAFVNNDIEFIKHGVHIKENYLPNFTTAYAVVNEVQTVTISGTLSAGVVILADGKGKETSIAYNANLAAIQTGLDALYGATNTVAAGTIASFTVTFAVALAGLSQTAIVVDGSGATGFTGANVVRTIKGGSSKLTALRSAYFTVLGKD